MDKRGLVFGAIELRAKSNGRFARAERFAAKGMRYLPHAAWERIAPRLEARRLAIFIEYLNRRRPDLRVRVLDVGARRGLQDPGYARLVRLNGLHLEGIEPDADEARRLEGEGYHRVHPVAVADEQGERIFHLTAALGCASIREPLQEEIAYLDVAPWFQKTGETTVATTTLDALFPVARFDMVNIDVQAAEADVLRGAKKFLAGAAGVSLEGHLTPFYRDHPLFPEILTLMTEAGFVPLMLSEESWSNNGLVSELNVGFGRPLHAITSPDQLLKQILFALMCKNQLWAALLVRERGRLLDGDEAGHLARLLDLSLESTPRSMEGGARF